MPRRGSPFLFTLYLPAWLTLDFGRSRENDGFFPTKTDKSFSMVKLLLILLYLSRGQRAKAGFREAADYKGAEHTAIAAPHSTIERSAVE